MTEQAAAVVDETTDAASLLTQLEYGRYAHRDPVPDWHDAKPFEAMVGVLLLQELEDASDGWLHRTLVADPDLAADLGFDPDDPPSRSTISRAWSDRLADVSSTIETTARQIHQVAAERGSPIGTPYADSASEEPSGGLVGGLPFYRHWGVGRHFSSVHRRIASMYSWSFSQKYS